MADRVVLHIGTMKSGTSFVQGVLGQNKEALADQGVLFPGQRWREQVLAVRELIAHGGRLQSPLPRSGHWASLVDEIRAWPGTAVISMEYLAPRSARQIERIRDSFPDSRVEALVTGRDLGRNVPAMWLESMQNGGVVSWEDYLLAVRSRKDPQAGPSVQFWRHQDLPAIARRWSDALSGHLTLVTVPPPGAASGLLWERVAGVLGVSPDSCRLDVPSNPGLGLSSALLLLELNRLYRSQGEKMPAHYDRLVKRTLSKRGLAAHSGDEPRLGFDERWIKAIGTEQIDVLRKAGHRVVGDLDELRPVAVRGVQPKDVSRDDLARAAAVALDIALLARPGKAGQDPAGKGSR